MLNKTLKEALETDKDIRYIKFVRHDGKCFWVNDIQFDVHTRNQIYLVVQDARNERNYKVQSFKVFVMDFDDDDDILIKNLSIHPEEFYRVSDSYKYSSDGDFTILVLEEV